MKRTKRTVIIAVLAVVAALVLEIIQINTWPRPTERKTSEDGNQQEITVFPDDYAELFRYEYTDEGLEPVGGDPQIYVYIEDSERISIVSFHFSNPLTNPLSIQVFYPGENGIEEEYSVVETVTAGTENKDMFIPAGEYPFLRIDIDGAPIPLESIRVVDGDAVETVVLPQKIHILRLLIVAISLFAVLFWMEWCGVWASIRNTFRNAVKAIRKNVNRSVLCLTGFLAATGISVFLFWICYSVIGGKPMNSPRIVFAGLAGVFAACLLVFRKTLKTQPEYLFLVLVIVIGFLYSYYVPHTGLNGWDEDYHYKQALEKSYVDSVVITPQDEKTIHRLYPASYDLSSGIEQLNKEQDEMFRTSAVEAAADFDLRTTPELFNGIGLYVGRMLGLRYHLIHFMGRFFGVITYAVVGFFAIRRLKSGKMMASLSLMIPTGLFIASSYNYDSYLTCFTALGLCYYVAQWQERKAKVTLKDAIIMIASISFGCVTKVIYIPLLWILLLLPRDKFSDRKQHLSFLLSVAVATGLIVISYMLNIGVTGGDTRGGESVNSGGQIQYILSDLFAFVQTLWNYMINEFFNLNNAGQMITSLSYHGVMPHAYLYFTLMITAAFTDKNEYDRELVHHPWAHIWPLLVSLGIVILIMTSMYVVYTPVGANYINGAQYRYLLPLILPVLMHIGSGLVENRMNRGWYNGLILSVAAFVNFSCVYLAFITRYY